MASARRIDVHLHIIPQFYRDIVHAAGLGPARRAGYPPADPELALKTMDDNEVEVALTSVAQPGVQFAQAAEAKTMARRLNEYASELMAKYPQRFGALSIVPMRNIEDAVAEVAYALDTLNHDGVSLFASYDEKFLGDPTFDPVMAELNKRKAPVFVHPTLHPSSRGLDLPWPAYIMEYLFDTTRAVVNLILGGGIDRYPDIKFILAHAGGTVPYFAWRLASVPQIDPTMPQWTRAQFAEKLKHFWYDTAFCSNRTTMGALQTVAAPDKIVFGTDFPFVPPPLVAEEVKAHLEPGLHSEAERAAIDRGNALKLFPRFG